MKLGRPCWRWTHYADSRQYRQSLEKHQIQERVTSLNESLREKHKLRKRTISAYRLDNPFMDEDCRQVMLNMALRDIRRDK
jgi:hypothetical protein